MHTQAKGHLSSNLFSASPQKLPYLYSTLPQLPGQSKPHYPVSYSLILVLDTQEQLGGWEHHIRSGQAADENTQMPKVPF